MNARLGLSLAQAPPISVPLRFFFTAPLFGMLAAAVLLWAGPEALTTRWAPATLAVTHLLTLGFISMVMIGALSQMTAVLAGAPMPRPLAVSTAVHALLTLGALALSGGLLFDLRGVIELAMLLLASGLLLFISVAAYCLVRARARNATVVGMRLAVAALLVTVVLGLRIAAEHIWIFAAPLPRIWTDVHLGWGLAGWVAILVVGVAYEVVPMFQMTPPYPQWMRRWLVKFLLASLVVWSGVYLSPLFDPEARAALAYWLSLPPAIALAAFAGVTLRLQLRRRRRVLDVTVLFWRVAMLSLIFCAVFWAAGGIWRPLGGWEHGGYLVGALFIAGFAVSAINGMLYKIVPFLVWLHLQGQNAGRVKLPNMKDIIPDWRALRQFRCHVVAVPALGCAVLKPGWFLYPALLLFGVSFLLLWLNVLRAVRIYRTTSLLLARA